MKIFHNKVKKQKPVTTAEVCRIFISMVYLLVQYPIPFIQHSFKVLPLVSVAETLICIPDPVNANEFLTEKKMLMISAAQAVYCDKNELIPRTCHLQHKRNDCQFKQQNETKNNKPNCPY